MKRMYLALLVAALAGCGGGGGGGSSPGVTAPAVAPAANGGGGGTPQGETGVPPASSSPYPTLSTVDSSNGGVRVYTSVMSNEPPASEPTRGQVTARADGAGNFTFTVNAQPGFDAYTFTVGVANAGALTSILGTSCGNCWRGGNENITTPTVYGTFWYLDPTAAGFSYLSLGAWVVRREASSFSQASGAGVFGVPTRTADIPKTGTASYSGQFIGTYRVPGDYAFELIGATANATANFATGVVALSTTNSQRHGGPPAADTNRPQLDFAGTMTGMSSNQLRGVMATKGGLTGDAHGAFFGPSAQELGGAVVFRGSSPAPGTPSEAFQGAFGLKR